MRQIELLAPARDYEHGYAALLCGADALYVGAPRFGARAAAGVAEADIARLCRAAHGFGARVYVAMNTLLYDDELAAAEQIAIRMWEAGADALIVQDMAFLRMNLPPVALHASTQTCNLEPEQIRFLARAGFSRVILERALHRDEIREIEKPAREEGVGLEAFVHGAICVGYSGRCYLSRSAGPRSGNRGDCSQPCRVSWTLFDERMQSLIRDRHLLSVQDLNLTPSLEEMIDIGVDSFKIEGRLKDIAYVKNIVSWYRHRLDAIIASHSGLERSSRGVSSIEFEPAPQKSFSRGASLYFFSERRNRVASFDTPKAVGERIGRIERVGRDFFELASDETSRGTRVLSPTFQGETNGPVNPGSSLLSAGDGICFVDAAGSLRGTHINGTEGGRIYPNRMEGLKSGMELFRNHDATFVAAAGRSRDRRSLEVTAQIEITATGIRLTYTDGDIYGEAFREGAFDPAQQPARAEETIRTQVAKTGDTVFRVTKADIVRDAARFVPLSLLNELRREATARLSENILRNHTRPPRKPEDKTFPYPTAAISGEMNVTNRLSEAFYRDHGVRQIEPGYDLQADLAGKRVMQSRYCLRHEIGECLREHPRYRGKLYLGNGPHRYELQFDCTACRMDLIYCGRPR